MKSVIILDLDGVLITTPSWQPDTMHEDGYSDFDQQSKANFNVLLDDVQAEIWLSSSRRLAKTLSEWNQIFVNRKIHRELTGLMPVSPNRSNRCEEIEAFLTYSSAVSNFLILDDDASLEDSPAHMKKFWVRTYPLIGFSYNKLEEARKKIALWCD